MSKKLLLKNGRIIDPVQNLGLTGDVLIVDGKVAEIGEGLQAPDVEAISCEGHIVAPGFIDPLVFLGEPGKEYKDDLASGTAAAVAGGFTTIAVTPGTTPVNDCRSTTEFIARRAEAVGACNVLPIGAVSKGLQGETLAEVGDMVKGGIGALTEMPKPIGSSQLLRRALEYASLFGLALIQHPEDVSLSNNGLMHEGLASAKLGMAATPSLAETLLVERDIRMAEWLGGRLHFAQLSAAGSVELVAAARERSVDVSASVTPHHLLFTDENLTSFDPNFRVVPPLRAESDRHALIQGVKSQAVTALTSGHRPQTTLEKDVEFDQAAPGCIGLETALSVYLDVLYRQGHVPLERIVSLCSVEPAKLLNLNTKGSLKVGNDGDVTVFSPDAERRYTLDGLRSKSRNCPFVDTPFRGGPVMTIVGGAVAWRHESV